MPLQPFNPPAGMFNDGTSYSIKGVWNTGDKVRFRSGFPEKIGGWTRLTIAQFDGVCRALKQWSDMSSVRHIAVGTNTRFYVENSGSVLIDQTPLRAMPLPSAPIATSNADNTITVTHKAHGMSPGDRVRISGATAVGGISADDLNTVHTIATTPTADTYTIEMDDPASATATGGGDLVKVEYSEPFSVPMGSNPFETDSGSSLVTVTHDNHGCTVGDFVTFGGATAVGGITLDGEYKVTTIIDPDTYVVDAGTNATSSATGGGTDVTVQYYLTVGLDNYTVGTGWGAGGWGSGTWGFSSSSGFGHQIRLWSMDPLGENLVLNPRGGAIYIYSVRDATRARDITLLSTADAAPTQANFILTTPEDRRVIAFGCTDQATGAFDPLLIRWSDREDPGNWNLADLNATAGFLRLSSGSEIKCAVRARGEILVWTEGTLSAMRFVDELIYGITMISPNIDILGPNSVIAVDDSVFWIGRENFFVYDGRVQVMPCSARQYVFGDINLEQAYKITAASNRLFREVTWFYPSADSSENNRYVTLNYAENVWYFGSMERTAWSDAGITNHPIAASPDGYIYYHETGWDDGSTDPPTPLNAYIESSPVELGEGDRFSFVTRIIPDITFDESTVNNPSVTYSLTPSDYPGAERGAEYEKNATRIPNGSVEKWTEKLDVRIRGRQFVLRVESNGPGIKWRLGTQRFDVRPDGRR